MHCNCHSLLDPFMPQAPVNAALQVVDILIVSAHTFYFTIFLRNPNNPIPRSINKPEVGSGTEPKI